MFSNQGNLVYRIGKLCIPVLAGMCLQHAAHAQWKPDKTVEMVVPTAAGGGNDKTARVIKKIWDENKMVDAAVTNKVGGGGSLTYTYVSQKTGDPHFIAITQAGLVTNHISGLSPVHYSDLTPLAFIGNEPVGFTVRVDSPFKSVKEFADQLKKDPQSLTISVGSTRGAINHFTVALLAKAAGIDPKPLKILVFGGGAEATTALLGGHIHGTSLAINNAIPHHKAGKLRILAISTPRALIQPARCANLPRAGLRRSNGREIGRSSHGTGKSIKRLRR